MNDGMKHKLLPFLLLMLLAPASQADETSIFKFSGFGTLAASTSNNHAADYRISMYQKDGLGYSRSVETGLDSVLGLQTNATFTPELQGVVQVVVDRNYDNTWKPDLEWANLKYDFEHGIHVRLGRVMAPTSMQSDYRSVGYAQTMARPATELYFANPITHLDGIGVGGSLMLGPGQLGMQLIHGGSRNKLDSRLGRSELLFHNLWIADADYRIDDLRLHAGISQAIVETTGDSIQLLQNMLQNLLGRR
jgi:hypothetical protein